MESAAGPGPAGQPGQAECPVCHVWLYPQEFIGHFATYHRPDAAEAEPLPARQRPKLHILNNQQIWPHQKAIYQELISIKNNPEIPPEGWRILLYVCTGGGKTSIVAMVQEALEAKRVLIVSPTTRTRDEIVAKLLGTADRSQKSFLSMTGALQVGMKDPEVHILDETGRKIQESMHVQNKILKADIVVGTAAKVSNSRAEELTLDKRRRKAARLGGTSADAHRTTADDAGATGADGAGPSSQLEPSVENAGGRRTRGSQRNSGELSEVIATFIQMNDDLIRDGKGPLFEAIVFDEGHHTPATTWMHILNTLGSKEWTDPNGVKRKPYVLFLTGTPDRIKDTSTDFPLTKQLTPFTLRDAMEEVTVGEENGVKIGPFVKKIVLINVLGKQSSDGTEREAVAMGSKGEAEAKGKGSKGEAESKGKGSKGEAEADAKGKGRGRRSRDKAPGEGAGTSAGGSTATGDAMTKEARVARELEAQMDVMRVVAHLLAEKRGGSKRSDIPHRALVQLATHEQCVRLCNAIEEAKLPLGPHRVMRAKVIHGNLSEQKRDDLLRDFKAHTLPDEAIDVLINCKLLCEGYDESLISVCVVLQKHQSRPPLAQFIGRAVRLNKEGTGVPILDKDNVCHVVTHAMYDQVGLFKEFAQQAVYEGVLENVGGAVTDGQPQEGQEGDTEQEEQQEETEQVEQEGQQEETEQEGQQEAGAEDERPTKRSRSGASKRRGAVALASGDRARPLPAAVATHAGAPARPVRLRRYLFPPYAKRTDAGIEAANKVWRLERETYFTNAAEWIVEDVEDAIQ